MIISGHLIGAVSEGAPSVVATSASGPAGGASAAAASIPIADSARGASTIATLVSTAWPAGGASTTVALARGTEASSVTVSPTDSSPSEVSRISALPSP